MKYVGHLSGVLPVTRISRCGSEFLLTLQANIPASVSFTLGISRVACLTMALEEISTLPDTEHEQNQPRRSSGRSNGDEQNRSKPFWVMPVLPSTRTTIFSWWYHSRLPCSPQSNRTFSPGFATTTSPSAGSAHSTDKKKAAEVHKSCVLKQKTNRCRTFEMLNI